MTFRHRLLALPVFGVLLLAPLSARSENPPPLRTPTECAVLADPVKSECVRCVSRKAPHVYLTGRPPKTRCFGSGSHPAGSA